MERFYSHYAAQSALTGILIVSNWRILLVQTFTAHMALQLVHFSYKGEV